MDDTDWDKYGVGKYEKCADCMVHCGFEATAVKDMFKHPLKALTVALRGVRTDGPMAKDISPRRPAARRVRLLRPCRAEARRHPQAKAAPRPSQGSGARGVRRERPRSASRPVRISAGNCQGFAPAGDRSTAGRSIVPSGRMPT